MRNCHSNASTDGKFSTPNLIQYLENDACAYQLTDVDYAGEDEDEVVLKA